MKFLFTVVLALMLAGVQAQEPPLAPPSKAAAAVGAETAAKLALPPAGPAVAPTTAALQQAFDGAMTCSALSAIKARDVGAEDHWRWGNRAFAFGMLAARFYTDQIKKPVTNEEMDNFLTTYANALGAMPPAQREPFETGCARKYTMTDRMCETNPCPHKAPAPAPAKAAP